MAYTHRSVDSLHGDEPEIDALANRAEAGRDIDAEIRTRKERLAAMDEQTVYSAEEIVKVSLRVIALCTEMARFPLAVSLDEGIELEGHAARLKMLCREMAK